MSATARNTIAVFRSRDFAVTDGVAEGDGISFMDDLMLDDIYQRSLGSAPCALVYEKGEGRAFIAAEG